MDEAQAAFKRCYLSDDCSEATGWMLDTKEFEGAMTEVVKALPNKDKEAFAKKYPITSECIHPNERIYHGLFDQLMLPLPDIYIFGTEVEKGHHRTDSIGVDVRKKRGMVVEHKHFKDIDKALDQAAGYGHFLESQELERILFFALNFTDDACYVKCFVRKVGELSSEKLFKEMVNRDDQRRKEEKAKKSNK